MSEETSMVAVTERIAFLANGGSHHVWTLPDGSVWLDEVFEISPVLFRKPYGIEMETAADRGIAYIERKTIVPAEGVK